MDDSAAKAEGTPDQTPPTKKCKTMNRRVGSFFVHPIGFGEWPLSDKRRPSRQDSLAQIHRALDGGVTLIDTADAYCLDESEKHHGERLVTEALASYRGDISRVVVATKGGCTRHDGTWARDTTSAHIQKTIKESWEAMGRKTIALWQVHAVEPLDPGETIASILEPVQEAVNAGLIKHVGLSNCSLKDIKAALAVLPVGVLASVQNNYPFYDLEARAKQQPVLEYCQANDIAFLPYAVLGGGAKRGKYGADKLREVDVTLRFPVLNALAAEKGTSPEAVILSWMLHRWPHLVHIVGARSAYNLGNSLSASSITLSPEQVTAIEADS